MNKLSFGITGLYLVTAALTSTYSVQAQSFPNAAPGCVYLREVTTGRTAIRKLIATNNSNANTDFVVPTGTSFNSYIGKLIPENNAKYRAEINLKYNDNTSDQAVDRPIQARRYYLYQQPFRTPTNRQPFQINTRITGDRNNAYQLAVLACR
jgi:hypothetical protein